ncbi:MAG: hypothetical protein BMS9Abin05_0067 [Rhodothermia bacterium]|nr:MAG: hypothetical protein BMS9Abin05_0067 [Rhodothermia bacterium]
MRQSISGLLSQVSKERGRFRVAYEQSPTIFRVRIIPLGVVMKDFRPSLVALLTILAALPAQAQEARLDGLSPRAAFGASYPDAIVRWDHDAGRADLISGVRLDGLSGTPWEVAVAALKRYSSLFGIQTEESHFEILDVKDSRAGGRRILARVHSIEPATEDQTFLIGINRPIVGRRYYIDGNGRVAAPGYVFVSSSDARAYDETRDDWYVFLMARTDQEEGPALVSVSRSSTGPEAFAGIEGPMVDSPLKLSLSISPATPCPGDAYTYNGQGLVYRTNPLNGDPEEVTLSNLCDQTPVFLSGRVVDVAPESGLPISEIDGNFKYSPDTPGFDDVSVYYHIDNFLSMMFNHGIDPGIADDWKIQVYTNSAVTNTMVARYRYQELKVGEPVYPYRNVVYEAAIIAHETTHLLMYDHVSSSYLAWGEKEHWAMGESYADYFGLVYRSHQLGNMEPWRQPVIGQYHVLETTEDLARDLSSREPHYSGYGISNYVGNGVGDSFGNMYDNSMIFSTALMDYDRLDESDHSSSFVIESLVNRLERPSFARGRDALMAAVNECALIRYPSEFECCESGSCDLAVRRAFSGRGIAPADGIVTSIAESSPSRQLPNDSPILSANNFPNPFETFTTIQFSSSRPAQVDIRIYDAHGKLIDELLNETRPAGQHSIQWRPNNVSSGAYFFEIAADGFSKRGSVLFVK